MALIYGQSEMSNEHLFLSVGAMKAGTTWLHQQLATHKDIHFCPEKEIHYFADPNGKSYMSATGRVQRYQQVVRNLTPDRLNPHVQRNLAWYGSHYLSAEVNDDWYTSLFETRAPVKKNAKYVADFSNLYATLDIQGWDHIRSVYPQVKAIYTMRHPAKRMWSHFKFQYEHSGRASELADISQDKIDYFLREAAFTDHIDYAGAVERLRNILSPEQIEFFFFEDFRERPLESLSKIEKFLDITPGEYREDRLNKKVNPSTGIEIPDIFRNAVNPLHTQQCERLTALGFTLPESWAKAL